MKRELKFRAWNTSTEQMQPNISIETIYSTSSGSSANLIWLQYTGGKDKNGKGICEGDILEWNDIDNHIRYVCKYDTVFPRFLFKQVINRNRPNLDKPSSGVSPSAVVIGNIYENPELLEKKVL